MDADHKLIRYRLSERHEFWELAGAAQGSAELQKRMRDPRTRESCHKLFLQIGKIIDYGISVSCGTGKLRCLDAKMGLYEIKGFDGANREMAYIICKEPAQIVLLHWFRGHQGSGNIQREMDACRKSALVASMLMSEADELDEGER